MESPITARSNHERFIAAGRGADSYEASMMGGVANNNGAEGDYHRVQLAQGDTTQAQLMLLLQAIENPNNHAVPGSGGIVLLRGVSNPKPDDDVYHACLATLFRNHPSSAKGRSVRVVVVANATAVFLVPVSRPGTSLDGVGSNQATQLNNALTSALTPPPQQLSGLALTPQHLSHHHRLTPPPPPRRPTLAELFPSAITIETHHYKRGPTIIVTDLEPTTSSCCYGVGMDECFVAMREKDAGRDLLWRWWGQEKKGETEEEERAAVEAHRREEEEEEAAARAALGVGKGEKKEKEWWECGDEEDDEEEDEEDDDSDDSDSDSDSEEEEDSEYDSDSDSDSE
ncbi:hypothetical protein EDC01DRAFT_636705 [Geopyxis carbonaria]|nr:hypothetical protein EDC01DRAFT_636705 [Geopyxis carbonaria]